MNLKLLFSALILIAQLNFAGAAIIYVKANAGGSNNGTNWANAFTSLQDGISASSTGDQIWVAAGTYKPTATIDRNARFQLPTGVRLYGGFAGTETQLSERDWTINESILSGDIGSTGTAGDNSYHVVVAYNVTANTRFDGFKVINGYADYITGTYYGGGMAVIASSLTVANCNFTANHSGDGGGAISHSDDGALTTGIINIINCSFTNNTSETGSALFLRGVQSNVTGCNISNNEGGETIWADNTTLNMDRCIISGNTADTQFGVVTLGDDAAVINVYNSLFVGNYSTGMSALDIRGANVNSHRFWNCTVAGNRSTDPNLNYACAVNGNLTTSFRNCIVWGNQGFAQFLYSSQEDVQNCIVQGGYTGAGNTNVNPLFISPGNSAQTPFDAAGFNYLLQSTSPAINGGNNTFTSNIYNLDLNDSARISALTVDQGCYEKQFCSSTASITASGPLSFCKGSFVTLTASTGNTFVWSNGANSQSIAADTAGVYRVNVVDANGCFGSDSKTVVVYPASVTISGNPQICGTGNTTLTAASPNGTIFSWSNSTTGAANTVSQAANYTVTVTTVNSCTASATVAVTVNTLPTPVITQNGNSISASTTGTYQWYLNGNLLGGVTTQSFVPTQNGTYTVKVVSNGCPSEISAGVTITSVGIYNLPSIAISVFPNPAGNFVTIETGMHEGTYRLFDMAGRLVLNGEVTGNKFTVDLSAVSKGIYTLTLNSQNTSGQVKLVKE